MFKNLFNNIGYTLEKMGKILFYFYLIVGILSPLILFLLDVWSEYIEFVLAPIVIIPLAFFIGLPLCGFGRLISNTEKNKEK